ncbi:MAG: hypothetical protein HY747_00165 [Elusimicrobia bacterium]|nr:hypothetical protein [Elusimicrobiota bacterium]
MKSPKIVAADTIECWLDLKSDALRKILPRVNIFFMNESEAKRFSGEPKVLRAARTISRLGPRLVIIKSGEHGAMAYDGETDNCFWAPAFPTFEVVDPTGAGDSFAGGFLGTAVSSGDPFHPSMIKKALFMGNVMSSFAISAVSIDGLVSLKSEEIAKRLEILKAAVSNGEGDGGVTSQISSLLKSLSR